MSTRTLNLSDDLYWYMIAMGTRESDLLRRLRTETSNLEMSRMQISPEQGAFMTLLARLTGTKRAIEVGVFTGYSSLCLMNGMRPDGRLIACDVSEEWTSIAQRYWKEAGVHDRIDLRLAPATETLGTLDSEAGTFDLAFIDADKSNYDTYYEQCLRLLRPGGLIMVDNVLWGGSVVDPQNNKEDTVAIRELNQKMSMDQRVEISLVPIGDGLMLARKE